MGRSERNPSPCELSPTSGAVIVSDVENEVENVFVENDGYQLLPDSDIQEPLETESAANTEIEDVETTPSSVDNTNTNTFNELSKSDENNGTGSRDIVVDFDQVRAAMSRVTLPLSAMPAWAAGVPDAELGSFLRNRITSLQQRDLSSNESQP